jgi:hypothetical protein
MHERIRDTLVRNVSIALVVGVVVALVRRMTWQAWPATVLALWPSLGGHFVEVAFLDGARPLLPRSRVLRVLARLLWWLIGGVVLACGTIATAHALPMVAPPWRWWWIGAPMFVGIELMVHAVLALRGRPNFYRGDL